MSIDGHPEADSRVSTEPWACEVAGEGVTGGDAHHACRNCVLAMGAGVVNEAGDHLGVDVRLGTIRHLADWYEEHRHAHGLPPLPKGAAR